MAKVNLIGLPAASRSKWIKDGDMYNQFVYIATDGLDSIPVRTLTGESVDVFVQDQTTPLINQFFTREDSSETLAAATVLDTYTIELQAGHSASAGQSVKIFNGTRVYQGIILNVAVNTLTMDTPMCFAFPAGDAVSVGTFNAAVNGSVTRQIFSVEPAPNLQWDVTEMVVYIVGSGAMDDTTFGDIASPGLTRGVVLRTINGEIFNIGNAKTNGGFKAVGCSSIIAEKEGGGEWSFNSVCQFSNDAGVTLRINGATGDRIEFIVQDDLSSITSITVIAIGHVVED